MRPLRKKLQKCRDPDRADLVALQRARREQVVNKSKPAAANDGELQGEVENREAKRRKLENADDVFGPSLG
jgi:cyclin H